MKPTDDELREMLSGREFAFPEVEAVVRELLARRAVEAHERSAPCRECGSIQILGFCLNCETLRDPGQMAGRMVEIDYENHAGERAWRRIAPVYLSFTVTPWHPEAQWILRAWDLEKHAPRDFAMASVRAWRPAPAAR